MVNSKTKLFFLTFSFLSMITFYSKSESADKSEKKEMTVYHSKHCGCCKKWMGHMKMSNFNIKSVEVNNVTEIKRKLGLPTHLSSCHTAKVDGYLIEGHIPAQAVQKFLKKPGKGEKGLAVPGMPIGSPGMEGATIESYHVISFSPEGKEKVFMSF